MMRTLIYVAGVAILSGCGVGSQFLYVEPNPATPSPGQGYVDFFVTTHEVECRLKVYHLTDPNQSVGVRVDSHAYLAEMAQPASRIVRVATTPGVQQFHISSDLQFLRGGASHCPGGSVTVTVREGTITPVHLGFDGDLAADTALDPIPYRRRESMPYSDTPGPDLQLQLIQLAAQVDPDSKRADGTTALMRAARDGQVEFVKLLLAAHANLNITTPSDNSTALWLSLDRKHFDVAQLLIDAGADPNITNKTGISSLIRAVQWDAIDTAYALMRAGANINVALPSSQSLLSLALEKKHPDFALALVNAGAPIDTTSHENWRPLLVAATEGYADVVKAMLNRHPALATDASVWNPVVLAAIDNDRTDVVRVLQATMPASSDQIDQTLLARAAARGNAGVVSMLLARNIDVTRPSEKGVTPLIAAAAGKHTEVARLLIRAKAPINARARDGSTALMWAAESGDADLVRDLIANNADPNVRSANGMTALAAAQEKNHNTIVGMLTPITSIHAGTLSSSNVVSPSQPAKVSATTAMRYDANQPGAVRINASIRGADGQLYTTDAVLQGELVISNFAASAHGKIIRGTLYASDATGHVMPISADMSLEQFLTEAQTRSVTLERLGFGGFRVGQSAISFENGKVADIET